MDKKEFVKRWKEAFLYYTKYKSMSKSTYSCCIYIELNDRSVMYTTRFVMSKDFSGHIKLFLNKEVIGHIPISSIKEVF